MGKAARNSAVLFPRSHAQIRCWGWARRTCARLHAQVRCRGESRAVCARVASCPGQVLGWGSVRGEGIQKRTCPDPIGPQQHMVRTCTGLRHRHIEVPPVHVDTCGDTLGSAPLYGGSGSACYRARTQSCAASRSARACRERSAAGGFASVRFASRVSSHIFYNEERTASPPRYNKFCADRKHLPLCCPGMDGSSAPARFAE